MEKLLILLCLLFLLNSCTLRIYEVNFNYTIGSNKNIESYGDYEEYKKEVAKVEEGIIYIPEGSGNLTVYIQADVPKQIDVAAEAELTPFSGSVIGK